MTYHKHGMGEIITLYFFIAEAGVGLPGESPVVAIRKNSSGEWLDDAKTAWQGGYNDIAMAELDATNLPGVYTLAITHIDATAEEYEIYFKNTGTYAGNDFEVHEFTGQVYVPATSTYTEGTIRGAIYEMKSRDETAAFDQSLHSLQAIYEDGIIANPVNIISAVNGSLQVEIIKDGGIIPIYIKTSMAIGITLNKDMTGRKIFFVLRERQDAEFIIPAGGTNAKEITSTMDLSTGNGLVVLSEAETDIAAKQYEYGEIFSTTDADTDYAVEQLFLGHAKDHGGSIVQ